MFKKWFITFVLFVLIGQFTFAVIPEPIPKIDTSFRQELARAKEKKAKQILSLRKELVPSESSWNVIYYSLHMTPDTETEILYGEVEIVGIVETTPLSMIGLNCWAGLNIVSVTSGNNPELNLNYKKKAIFDTILIDLEREYTQGEQISIIITYNGKPQESDYYAFDFSNHGQQPMIWTLSEPFGARSWWPCKDVPSDKADSVDIRITVPNQFIAVSNGSLREKTTNCELTTWWWHEQYPTATYLVSLAIYPYEVHYDNYLYNNNADTMKIHFYNFPGYYKKFENENRKVKHMIALFSKMFGEYPFIEEKYGQADFLGGGAMEHQTCSSFAFWGEIVFAHELAHQWWGDLITCDDFHHIWLNEGFATYCEALWYEGFYDGKTASEYQMGGNLYLGRGTIYVEDPENDVIFHGGLSYSKGSWVLHMLRHVMGDSVFFDILKTYYSSKHQYGSATTEDFQAICEQVSGKNLTNFFRQWIYDEWHPEYYFSWNWEDLKNGQFKVFGHIKQVQKTGPVFEMPLDITIQTNMGDTTLVLFNNERVQTFECIVNAKPKLVILDKDNWILKEVSGINTPVYSLNNYYIDDTNGNNNQRADAEEKVTLTVELLNTGVNVTNVELELFSYDPDITILQNKSHIDQIYKDEAVSNQTTPFEFSVSANVVTHFSEFILQIKSADGLSDSVNIIIPINIPVIMFVDDDAGDSYEKYICTVLDNNDIPYNYWDLQAAGLPDLSNEPIVFWSTGDDRDSTLTSVEQSLLARFLDNGGRLLLTGQNIGYDLTTDGTESDSLFYHNYLHATFIKDNLESSIVLGVRDDPIGDRLVLYFDKPPLGAGNQKSVDVITPLEPAVTFLQYYGSEGSAGIYNHNEMNDSRLVYLAFGLEGISKITSKNGPGMNEMMVRIIEWFSKPSDISAITTTDNLPAEYNLYPNYPNPFNPETRIKFDIPRRDFVTLKIYDILGREVTTLMQEIKAPGSYTLSWNASDRAGVRVPSGIYLYKITTGNFTANRKMLLLR
ncbi:T9SS type A sorting domain-containing protein [candidate division KSB1 bacterium]|nr:T9SS type A sorting domain-containing protein [candidate division KSB1 bacterium]